MIGNVRKSETARAYGFTAPPYSLGKLIDWKLDAIRLWLTKNLLPPYSLGKLIDWKLLRKQSFLELVDSRSLLAREIN